MVVAGTGDIAGAARTRAQAIDRVVHRFENSRMLPDPEVIVRAPDSHLGWEQVMIGQRKYTGTPLEVGEVPVTPFPAKCFQPVIEECVTIKHDRALVSPRTATLVSVSLPIMMMRTVVILD
jgi:hypothetical protein